ncbi:hypothetical protein HZY88_08110 [Aerococcaceae bacterium DSM 111176]|nr:hypothetical protein [Aerococcaceae bacterium DSM 111176]
MKSALVELVVAAIKAKYVSEKAFYNEQLGITPQSWDRWKKGEQGLKYENMQIISTLFTDYEWMLVQKVTRRREVMGDTASSAVAEFNYLKYQIAKTWINQGLARMEWQKNQANEPGSNRRSNTVVLRLITDYNIWGYSDIIEMRLPGVIQQQIGHDERKLLDWVRDQSDQIKQDQQQ